MAACSGTLRMQARFQRLPGRVPGLGVMRARRVKRFSEVRPRGIERAHRAHRGTHQLAGARAAHRYLCTAVTACAASHTAHSTQAHARLRGRVGEARLPCRNDSIRPAAFVLSVHLRESDLTAGHAQVFGKPTHKVVFGVRPPPPLLRRGNTLIVRFSLGIARSDTHGRATASRMTTDRAS